MNSDFWDKNDIMRAVLAKSLHSTTKYSYDTNKYEAYLFEIGYGDGEIATGYLTIPKNAASLKLYMYFRGYSATRIADPLFKDGYACVEMAPHGFRMDDPNPEYPPSNYGFDTVENQDHDTVYFHGMFVRNILGARLLKAYVGGEEYGKVMCYDCCSLVTLIDTAKSPSSRPKMRITPMCRPQLHLTDFGTIKEHNKRGFLYWHGTDNKGALSLQNKDPQRYYFSADFLFVNVKSKSEPLTCNKYMVRIILICLWATKKIFLPFLRMNSNSYIVIGFKRWLLNESSYRMLLLLALSTDGAISSI